MPPRKASTNSAEKEEHQGPAPDPTQALSAAIAMFDEEFEKLNLRGKISAISGWLGRIPKRGYNKFNSYWYVLESDLVEYIRYWLAAARILIYVESIREHTVFTFEGVTTGQNSRQRDILTDNIYVYRVVDGKSEETFTFEVNGQGSDPRDKGSNKASTGAMKFAYLRLFNISSGGEDEPEGDVKGDEDAALSGQGGGQQPTVTTTANTGRTVARGGKQEKTSGPQIESISKMSNQLQLGAVGLVGVIKKVLGDDVDLGDDESKHSKILAQYLTSQSGENAGKLIFALDEMVRATKVPNDAEPGYGS